MTLAFTVYGVGQPMGSKRAFLPKGWTRPVITDSNRSLKSWQVLVRQGASDALTRLGTDAALLAGGVRLTLHFALPRPVSLPKKVTAHTKAPDLDKLTRAVGDALTGTVFRDDAQITEIVATKRYAEGAPHVAITVEASGALSAGARLGDLGGHFPLLEER